MLAWRELQTELKCDGIFTWKEAEPRGGQHCVGLMNVGLWTGIGWRLSNHRVSCLWEEPSLYKRGSSRFLDRQTESSLRCHQSQALYWSVILIPSEAEVPASSVPKRDRNLITAPEFDLLSVLATPTVIVMHARVSVTSGGWLPLGPSLSLSNIKSPSIRCIINCNKLKGIILCGQNSPQSFFFFFFLPQHLVRKIYCNIFLSALSLVGLWTVSCLASIFSAF